MFFPKELHCFLISTLLSLGVVLTSKTIKKGAKIEPQTLRKHLPKTIVKKDAKKWGNTGKRWPFFSSSKSEIGLKGGKKTKKGQKRRTKDPKGSQSSPGISQGSTKCSFAPLGGPLDLSGLNFGTILMYCWVFLVEF